MIDPFEKRMDPLTIESISKATKHEWIDLQVKILNHSCFVSWVPKYITMIFT